MTGRIAVALMAVLLLVYLTLAGGRAVILLQSGGVTGIAFGVALLILPLIGLWALAQELRFGLQSGRLVRLLAEAGEYPVTDVAPGTGRKALRAAADVDFPRFQSAADAAPNDWRARFRLGLAYDASGDRRRARLSIRSAIALERAARPTIGADRA
jgi:hypothetical protein